MNKCRNCGKEIIGRGTETLCNSCVAPLIEESELENIKRKLNTPELTNFIEGVRLEAVHQQEKWGPEHDKRKRPGDWSLLLDYIKGKQVKAVWDGDLDKLKHHLITMSAICYNYHKCITDAKEIKPTETKGG